MASIDLFSTTPDMSFTSEADAEGTVNRNVTDIIGMLESPVVSVKEEKSADQEILATQPVQILKDVVALVEVRTGAENRSKAIKSKLRQLGASVVDKLSNDVTHVVWKDGKKSTVDRAKKKNIPVVNVLWVESCTQNEAHVAENLFAVHDQKEKGTPILLPRLKKTKSMQPKDFDEDVANSAEKGERMRKRRAKDKRLSGVPSSPTFFVAETQPQSPFLGSPFSPNITVPDTPASLRERFNCIKRNMMELQESNSESPESPVRIHPGTSESTPIQRKLFDNNSTDLSTPPTSPQPLSTSTQYSDGSLSIKTEFGSNENHTPTRKHISPIRKPLSPVTNTVKSAFKHVGSPTSSVLTSSDSTNSPNTSRIRFKDGASVLRKSPRLNSSSALSESVTDKHGLSSGTKDRQNSTNNKTRPIAVSRKKKLFATTDQPQREIVVPTSSDNLLPVATETGLNEPHKGSVNKNSKKSDPCSNSPSVSTKRKRNFESEIDDGQKKSKSSKTTYDNDKLKRATEATQNVKHTVSPKRRNVCETFPDEFTIMKDKKKKTQSKVCRDDVLLNDFESDYDNTVYLTSQSNKSKLWATTSKESVSDAQENELIYNKSNRRRSQKIDSTNVPSPMSKKDRSGDKKDNSKRLVNTTKCNPSPEKQRVTRRKSMALIAPDTDEKSNSPVIPTNVKGRRRSIAVCSSTNSETPNKEETVVAVEPRKSRRLSALRTNVDINLDSFVLNSAANEKIMDVNKITTRRASGFISPQLLSNKDTKNSGNNSKAVDDGDSSEDKSTVKIENIPAPSHSQLHGILEDDVSKKSRRRSGKHTPAYVSQPADIANCSVNTPNTPHTVTTPLSRRRSMRVFAIANSMQKSGTPLKYVPEDKPNDPSIDIVEERRQKDNTQDNDISVEPAPNKCPADFDSTAEESQLQLAKRKKKKGPSQTNKSQGKESYSITSSDSGLSEIDTTTNALSSVSVLSFTRSRKSIDEFQSDRFNISTEQKKNNKRQGKTSVSSLDSIKEESKDSRARSKTKKQTLLSKKSSKPSISDVASDINSDKANSKTTDTMNPYSESKTDLSCSTSDSDVQPSTGKRKRSSGSKSPKYTKSIVMTSLHSSEQETVIGIVKKIGGFNIVDTVDTSTTHVVCGANRRTLNVLYGIARGCWLVSPEWVFNSLEAGEWMGEEPFEVHDIFPQCQIARLERATAIGVYKQDLFSEVGYVYVSDSTAPPTRHLTSLLELCGGMVSGHFGGSVFIKFSPSDSSVVINKRHIKAGTTVSVVSTTQCLRKADVVVGAVKPGVVCVTEQWILDSVTSHESLPLKSYGLDDSGRLIRSPSPDY